MLIVAWIATLLTLVSWSGVYLEFYFGMLAFLSLALWTIYMIRSNHPNLAIVLVLTSFCATLVGLGHSFYGWSKLGLVAGLVTLVSFGVENLAVRLSGRRSEICLEMSKNITSEEGNSRNKELRLVKRA
ncbi:MAG: hypothetical protein Q8P83_01825 [bacterium]|nr:hypothetical protein [bacterium]